MKSPNNKQLNITPSISKVSFKAYEHERPGVSVEEVQQMKDVFDLFDPYKTGFVSTQDLIASLDALGSEPRGQPLYVLIADKLNQGIMEIQFEQFLDLMNNRVSNKDNKQDMRKLFNMFDEDKTGFISIKNLKKIVQDLGESIDDAQLQEMIEKADLDKDGVVSQDEFYQIMTKKIVKS